MSGFVKCKDGLLDDLDGLCCSSVVHNMPLGPPGKDICSDQVQILFPIHVNQIISFLMLKTYTVMDPSLDCPILNSTLTILTS